ncbi:MAG: CAP domain-containing protein [Solirubrobacteraceae bacterium]
MTATLCLIERERRAYHLGLLHSNGSLQRIAASQAKDMVVGDYFGDNSLAGGTPWQRITASQYASGAHSLWAAQNIGWGTDELATPAAMVNGWMLSPPHREIMLTGGYHDVGVGVAPAAPSSLTEGLPGATYTVEFAARGDQGRNVRTAK